MSDRETRTHGALLAASAGYAQFFESELRDARELGPEPDWEIDRRAALVGFADWLPSLVGVEHFVDWTAEQFRHEWERWNS